MATFIGYLGFAFALFNFASTISVGNYGQSCAWIAVLFLNGGLIGDTYAIRETRAEIAALKRKVKRPRLFYLDEGCNAYIPCPDGVEFIIDAEWLMNGEETEVTFKRYDMSDEEMDALPEE